MARQLEEINASGELLSIKKDGTDAEKEVATTGELDAAVALKENTADVDIKLATKLDDDVAQFVPQTDPGPGEGQIFYDSASHSLSVKNDKDMTLNLGAEEVIRVLNNSGADIPDTTPVYITGASGGLATVGLAQANTFTTAVVPGITTHLIPDGQEGYITHAGTLGGDFSAYAPGSSLFLSAVTAGGFEAVAIPDIATKLGEVLSATSMMVKISSNTALPPVMAYMNTADSITTLAAGVAEPIVNYADHSSVVMEYNNTTGQITVPIDGAFRVSFTLSMTFASTSGARSFECIFYDVTAAAPVFTIPTTITKDVASYDFATSAPFSALATHVYEFRVQSNTSDITGVVFQFTTFDIASLHIR